MESYTLTQINLPNFPRAFILESDSIDRLLVNPGRKLVGLERLNTAFEATTTWCRALADEGLLPAKASDVCSMTVLAEGMGHNLPAALGTALTPHYQRGDNFMGVSRFALPKNADDAYTPFDARVKYLRIESPAPVWVMLDTVATGATLVRGLEAAFANAPKPEHILLGTPAGSVAGMRKIAKVCAAHNVPLTLFFFGAMFGLWEDGTALPWCHRDSILSGTPRSEKNRALTARMFNNIEAFAPLVIVRRIFLMWQKQRKFCGRNKNGLVGGWFCRDFKQ